MVRASRASQGRWGVLGLVVLLLVGLAVVVSTAGPAQFGEPRIDAITGLDAPFDRPTAPAGGAGGQTADDQDPGLPGWTTAIWAMGVCMALVLVVRSLMRMLRTEPEAAETTQDEESAPAADNLRLLSLMRRGVRDAAEVLRDAVPGEAERDAVIRCWLVLEAAAARAGAGRQAAQTPTEFTAALLEAQHADPDATAQLLSLYHRARFSRTAVPADAIGSARDALGRIAGSLAASSEEQTLLEARAVPDDGAETARRG